MKKRMKQGGKGKKGADDRKSVKVKYNLKSGDLSLHRDGYGFLVTPDPAEDDIFIPARYIGDALHTDLVEVKLVDGRDKHKEGRVIRVLERRVKNLMGRLERHGKFYQVVADDRRVRHRIMIPDGSLSGAKHGDNVVVHILKYPSGDNPMSGEVIQVLGRRGEMPTEKAAVVARFQLPGAFPEHVLNDADEICRRVDIARACGERKDLRGVPFITIDGEGAKDFDDAVAAEETSGGKIRLWVSIADVSYYVHPGSKLDDEAYLRGTSVYFPGDCIPMLPEIISNDRCSLRPMEDRLTVTAEMEIDSSGEVVRINFYRSIIKSRERMTYTAVKKILVEKDAAARERYSGIIHQLDVMERCFNYLRGSRMKRGTIDFDLPEPEIVIDLQGDVSNITRAERHVGHMMIEEFMIAANESVARFLTENKAGCVYRVHEPPQADKLRELSILLHNLKYKFSFSKEVPSSKLAHVVNEVRGKPEERLVNHMLLRAMSQAVYSDGNVGHYGLASKCYCHFTSPIRRYPDLVVHRLLTRMLDGTEHTGRKAALHLNETAKHSSVRERIAMGAEREMAKLHATLFMQNRIGEEFDGVISHVTKFGFFVELIEFFVEGLVHVSALDDDHYVFYEEGLQFIGKRSKKRFRIGDRVRIEVEEVDVPNREISFILI